MYFDRKAMIIRPIIISIVYVAQMVLVTVGLMLEIGDWVPMFLLIVVMGVFGPINFLEWMFYILSYSTWRIDDDGITNDGLVKYRFILFSEADRYTIRMEKTPNIITNYGSKGMKCFCLYKGKKYVTVPISDFSEEEIEWLKKKIGAVHSEDPGSSENPQSVNDSPDKAE